MTVAKRSWESKKSELLLTPLLMADCGIREIVSNITRHTVAVIINTDVDLRIELKDIKLCFMLI